MFEVKSFFKKNNDFIPAAQFDDAISDPDYIEGAIEISQWNKKILTIENWDYVDQLWCYFVEGIEKVSKGMEFDTYLPYQPLLISFKPSLVSRKVLVTVGKDSGNFISVEHNEFLNVMIKEAKDFFGHMKRGVASLRDDLIIIENEMSKLSVKQGS